MLELRNYQRDAIDIGIYQWFQNHDGNVLVVIPTAGGKSLIIAQFLYEVFETWPDHRVLMLTHVHEIIRQNYKELIELWPGAPVGINSAGLKSRDLFSPIIFAGIQSVHKLAEQLSPIDLVVVDEAHLIPRAKNTMYMSLLGELKRLNPALKIIGFTATAFRLDSGMLHEGPDALFSAIGYEKNVRDLIAEKWLAPPRTIAATAQIDTSGVGVRLGEFIANQLEFVATDPGTVKKIVDEIVSRGEGRKGWLIFGCGVVHAEMMRDALRDRGITCECIFGTTKHDERNRIIEAFKAGEIQALSSMSVLTTGFNVRHVDLIALVRPTQSTGLYIQMVGRGLRTFPGKTDCLVLDFGGNIGRHGPIDAPRVQSNGGVREDEKELRQRMKICPICEATWSMAVRQCFACGYDFPPPERVIEITPAQDDILQTLEPKWLDVQHVAYRLHQKPGKPNSMRVEYHCGLSVHREWVCFEHQGYPREKAQSWWMRRGPGLPVPANVSEALKFAVALKTPRQILVRPAGKFTEIMGQRLG